MTNDEIISSLRESAEIVRTRGYATCANIMDLAADRLEEKYPRCAIEDGIMLKYDEATGEWGRYEVYMTVDCETEEDFEYLKQCVERQHARPPREITEGYGVRSFACPHCGESLFYLNQTPKMKILPPHCVMCGQKLLWEDDENEENSSI